MDRLGVKAMDREIAEDNGSAVLREPKIPYSVSFDPKTGPLTYIPRLWKAFFSVFKCAEVSHISGVTTYPLYRVSGFSASVLAIGLHFLY
jgi:hypothetical protein